MPAFFAFLHHLAAFTLVAVVVAEFALLRGELTLQTARLLPRIDLFYGIAAGVIIVVGILRVNYFEKGAAYYMNSIPFIIKMSAFLAMGLLSIVPTLEFLPWRKATKAGQLPQVPAEKLRRIRRFIHFELVAVPVILLCAALMARGVGELSQ